MKRKKGIPSTKVLVEASNRSRIRSRICILCGQHPWSKVITEALTQGASIKGLFRVLQEEGVTDVSFHQLKGHKANHVKDSGAVGGG